MLTKILSLLGLLIFVQVASAQNPAEAERLFQEGRQLRSEGRIAEACGAFDASYRAEANVSTLSNLAECREIEGKLATAWAHYVAATHQCAGHDNKVKQYRRMAASAATLEPRLSLLTIEVPDTARLGGLVITRNGTVVGSGAWNRAIPVDGGSYTITGTAPGHVPWSVSVVVALEGDRQHVTVPRLGVSQAVPPAQVPAPGAGGVGGSPSLRRVLALVAGGASLAAFASAAVVELSGQTIYEDEDLRDLVAQGLSVTGVLTAGAATYLWLSRSRAAPAGQVRLKPSSTAGAVVGVPILSSHFVGLALTGDF